MNELSDDPEVVDLLWEVMGATIRPAVSWNKTAWFYSMSGNNGKGTLCTLIRNLCGRGTWASVPLKAFSQQFMLEPLCRVSAIITDENDTGTFVDDAAALKSVITHDPFQINRKFKDPRTLMFHGFMIQCVNEFPKLKDKSESMYRRLLVIPFEKRFEGHERKYIKNDYLHRREVLEYVLYRLLYETDYYELTIPQTCKDMLADFKTYNDPIRQFCEEVLPMFHGICSRGISHTTCTARGCRRTSLRVALSASTGSRRIWPLCSRSGPNGRARRTRCARRGTWIARSR